MTLRCPARDCVDVKLVDDNGAEYPETRVEFFECADCGHGFRKELSA